MKMSLGTALCAAALMMLAASPASADPWKDESGKGQWRGSYGWQGDGYAPRRYRQGLRIPPGHLPPSAGSGVQASPRATSHRPSDAEKRTIKMSPCTALCAAALILAAGTASADSWKDESRKGHWRDGDYGWGEPERKFKFRSADGCEVERKWKKGEYEEKVKCKPSRHGHGY